MQKTDKNDKIRQRLLRNAIIDWENTSQFNIPTKILQEFYRYANYIFTAGYDSGYSDGKDAGKSMPQDHNSIPEEVFNRAKNIVETDTGVFCLDCFKDMEHSPQGRFINRYTCPICKKEVILKT